MRCTVICEEPNWIVRCMEEPRLKMLARQHGNRQKRDVSAIGKTLITYVRRAMRESMFQNVPKAGMLFRG